MMLESNLLAPLSALASGYITYTKSHPNNVPTCEEYALNTYLYTLTTLCILWTYYTFMEKSPTLTGTYFKIMTNFILFIIMLVFLVGFMVYLKSVDPQYKIKKHLLWLIFIFCFALLTLASYIILKPYLLYGVFGASVFAVITYIVIKNNPNFVTPTMKKYTSWAIVISIILLFASSIMVKDVKTMITIMIVVTLILIVAMVMKLLIHHKEIKDNEDKCKSGEIKPDYINESLGLFITFVNLMFDIARLLFLRKRR
jgi:hypothetical protein